ncbi:hypothetical protein HMI56_006827 [Coelomomyces lativittatus]|nr:hypothetical protein HMI56_006827 [Coelomomyces lativittatus]
MYPFISISADEVNFLVYRYLLESGFKHSVFAFQHESNLSEKLGYYRELNVKPGYLISLLHKALQLMQIDIHMDESGTERECTATLSLLAPHICIPRDTSTSISKKQKKLTDLQKRRRNGRPITEDSSQLSSIHPLDTNANPKVSSNSSLLSSSMHSTKSQKRHPTKEPRKKFTSQPNHDMDVDTESIEPSQEITSSSSSSSSSALFTKSSASTSSSSLLPSSASLKKKTTSKFPPSQQSVSTLPSTTSATTSTAVAAFAPASSSTSTTSLVDRNDMEIDAQPSNNSHTTTEGVPPAEDIVEVKIDSDITVDSDVVSVNSFTSLVGKHERYYLCTWNPSTPNLLVTASLDSVVGLWDLSTGDQKPPDVYFLQFNEDSMNSTTSSTTASTSDPPDHAVNCITWSPTGDAFGLSSKEGSVRVYSKTGRLRHNLTHTSKPGATTNVIFTMEFSPSGNWLVTGSTSGSVNVWDLVSGKQTQMFACHTSAIFALIWINETTFISGSADTSIVAYDVDKGEIMAWREHTGEINELKYHAPAKLFASCSDDTTIRIWDHTQSKSVGVLKGHEQPVLNIDWNPHSPKDSLHLASYVIYILFLSGV